MICDKMIESIHDQLVHKPNGSDGIAQLNAKNLQSPSNYCSC
jgi:hypothetical protein